MVSFAEGGKAEVLLSVCGSRVVLETVTLFVTWAEVFSVSVNSAVMVAPSTPGKRLLVQVMVPVPPGAGLLQLKRGPLVCVQSAKVLPEGTVSVSVTPAASFGPLLRTTTSNEAPPPVVETETSADGACEVTVVVRLNELFDGKGSASSADSVTVFVSIVPAATPLLTRNVKRNTGWSLLERWSKVVALQVMFPVVPTAGVLQVNDSSGSSMVTAAKVVFAGTASTSCT